MSDLPIRDDNDDEEEVSLMTDDQLATLQRRSFRFGRITGLIIGIPIGILLVGVVAALIAFTSVA